MTTMTRTARGEMEEPDYSSLCNYSAAALTPPVRHGLSAWPLGHPPGSRSVMEKRLELCLVTRHNHSVLCHCINSQMCFSNDKPNI